MMKSLQVCYIALFGCALEVFPPINDLMQLAPLPADGDAIVGDMSSDHAGLFLRLLILAGEGIGFKLTLCALMVLDTVVCIACEKALVNFFEPNVF